MSWLSTAQTSPARGELGCDVVGSPSVGVGDLDGEHRQGAALEVKVEKCPVRSLNGRLLDGGVREFPNANGASGRCRRRHLCFAAGQVVVLSRLTLTFAEPLLSRA